MQFLKPSEILNPLELKQLIPHLISANYTTSDLASQTDHLLFLLSSLSAKQSYKFIRTIDNDFPGLSFHFIMEARYSKNKHSALFLFRISYHMIAFPDIELFQPMRKRLISGLLFDEDFDQQHFNELHNLLNTIEQSSLGIKEKKKISKIIFQQYFEFYFNHLYNQEFKSSQDK